MDQRKRMGRRETDEFCDVKWAIGVVLGVGLVLCVSVKKRMSPSTDDKA